MSATALFLASILSLAAAGPAPFQTFVVQESLHSAPEGFSKVGPAADSSPVNLRIALASSDVAGLEKTLLDVSTPSSFNYGNHLTKAEVSGFVLVKDFNVIHPFYQVNSFLAPPEKAVAAVQAWLASHGLVANTSSSAGDWLSLTVPVSKANEMLAAKYETFKHLASGKTYARTLSYSLPVEIADFVVHIYPTVSFNNPVSMKPVLSVPQSFAVSSDAAASCAKKVTPSMFPFAVFPSF
jgi:tripeptidyl-peptidase-1